MAMTAAPGSAGATPPFPTAPDAMRAKDAMEAVGAMDPAGSFVVRDPMGQRLVQIPQGYENIPVLVTAIVFGCVILLVVVYLVYRFRRLRLIRETDSKVDSAEVVALQQERDRLAARVVNLERVVSSLDLEMQSRIERLADKQVAIDATVAALPTPAGVNGTTVADVGAAVTMAVQAPRGELPAGSVLMGRFEVERALGRGGMGAVYLATDRELGERVALKVITRELSEDGSVAERFRREAGAARKVTHPSVIRIHDLGTADGMLFLTMEYFAGRSLADLLQKRHVLPLEEAQTLLEQVCDGLMAAHAAGVVHRDLKPQNVLVNDRGEVRVIDFGIAKAGYMKTMTVTGMMMGTPEYMAPEQVRGRPVDHRADIYSLGAMSYHMVCGRPPFVADTPIAVGFLHCSEDPTPPSQLTPALPDPVADALLRALAKEPRDRFDSVSDFRDALTAS